MAPEDPRDQGDPPTGSLDDISRSILDGSRVDWTRASSELDTRTLRALRDLERITEFNRLLQPSSAAQQAQSDLDGKEVKRWGDLTLLELVGAGARGEVWRAWDPTLQRDVALKFLLPAENAGGPDARTALLDEARALARVRHPGVVTVYGIAEHEGRVGMWMEYLRGATLAQEIERRGALPASEVARIGSDICAALQVVHAAGLVHRDIKPANIIVESDGRVVLADFGLGMRPRLEDRDARRSSGTPIFMAPEVLSGQQATPQSDLYALGVTLLWALKGDPPFQSRTLDELREEATRGPTAALQSVRRSTPGALLSGIEWAAAPDAAMRPRNASDLAARLRLALDEIDAAVGKRRRLEVALGIVAAVGIVALALALFFRPTVLDRPMRGSPSLAVLPLVNLSGDPNQDYLTDGMTEELIARLARIEDLRVISRSSVMQFKNSKEPLPEIAKKLHVRTVVEGSVSSAGDRVRISARLVDAQSGRTLWADDYDGDLSNVFDAQREIAQAVVRRVNARVTPGERDRLGRATEVSPEAHRLYLQGLAAYRSLSADGIRRALVLFRRAIEIEPRYAEAWLGLAYAYNFSVAVGVLSEQESSTQSVATARRALELDPQNGPTRAALAGAQLDFDWDFKAAERGYREALALSPGDSDVRTEFVVLLVQLGRLEEAIEQAKRARDTDPVSLTSGAIAMLPLYEARRYQECARLGRDLLVVHPEASWLMLLTGMAQFLGGRQEEGIQTIERSMALDRIPPSVGWLGYAYGCVGKREQAQAILTELEQTQQKTYIDPYFLAIVHLGLGEKSRALDYIEKAGLSHSPEAKFLRVDPVLDPLRSEPRFRALLRRLGMVG